MQGDNDIPNINSRLVSSVQKREVMWNIIEPGDPYDIRKSMIARLPGQRAFMGDHLELVCLLQAAQIERLCEYLEEYKLKFREVERRELDRHSYQIQIKELTMRIAEQANFKAENLKLREFLRKQSTEFEELKKRTTYDADLLRKYEDSLRQAEAFVRENESLRKELEETQRRLREVQVQASKSQAFYKLEIDFKKLEFENKRFRELAQSKNREIQELQARSKQLLYQLQEQATQTRQLAGNTSVLKEYQNRFALLGQQIQRLNGVLREKSGQLSQTNSRVRASEQERRRQGQYITELEHHGTQLEQHVRQLEIRLREAGSNLTIMQQNRARTYQANIQKLSSEIDRLNTVLRKKVTQLDEANRRASEGDYEVRRSEAAKREVQEFRTKFSQFNRKMAEYETRIAITTQEIERLTIQLKRKTEEASSLQQQLRTKNSELEQAQNTCYSLQVEHQSQITRLTSSYEGKITEITREMQASRSRYNDSQLDRLTSLIANKTTEIDRLQSDLLLIRQRSIQQESEVSFVRQENQQLKGSLQEYQRRIVMLSTEIQRLNTVLKKGGSPSRQKDEAELKRIAQYENKLAILNQEIQRLTEAIRLKQAKARSAEGEAELLRRRQEEQAEVAAESRRRETQWSSELQKMREELRVAQQQLTRKNSDHQLATNLTRESEVRVRQLYEQNHELTRSLADSQHQITVLAHEIDRLNGVLKLKVEALENLQGRARSFSREGDELRKKLAEYENKLALIAQESERTRNNIQLNSQFELEAAKRRLQEQERRISELETASRQAESRMRILDSQSRNYEQQLRISQQEVQAGRSDVSRRYGEYQTKMNILGKEIERLNSLLQRFTTQNVQLKRRIQEQEHSRGEALQERLGRASQENQELRRRLIEIQQSKQKTVQQWEVRVRQVSSQRQQVIRRSQQQESKLAYLMQELEHSNSLARDRTDQVNALQNKVRSLIQENDALGRRVQELGGATRKIAQGDSKIALLSQQIQRLNAVLKSKIQDATTWENRFRTIETQSVSYQRRVTELESNVVRDLQNKNTQLAKENEQLRMHLRQTSTDASKLPEIENRLALTLGELERLNVTLRSKTEQIVTLTGKARNLEMQVERSRRKSEEIEATMHRELRGQSSVFEQRIQQLSEQGESLRKSLREATDTNRKIPQLQNKLVILSNQIERLNQLLHRYSKEVVPGLEEKARSLSLQCEQYRRKVSELGEINKQGQELASKVRIITQESEQNARRVQEYQARMSQVSGQIERLNTLLRSKLQEVANFEARLRQAQGQNQLLGKRLRQAEVAARRAVQCENKTAQLGQEIQRLNVALRTRNEQASSAESKLRLLEHEFDSLQRRFSQQESSLADQKRYRIVLEQKITAQNIENEELRKTLRELSDSNRRLSEYESRLALLSQEIERLNSALRMKTEEFINCQTTLRSYRRQSESKMQHLSTELEEFRRKASQNMSAQAGRLAEYEGKMVLLSKEIERLNIVLKESSYELENSQHREKQCVQEIQRLNNTLRLKLEEATRWEQMSNELKLKLRAAEEAFSNVSTELQRARQQCSKTSEDLRSSNQHLSEYEQSINKLYQEFQRLQSIIQTLKKENYELRVRLQDAGTLAQKNRGLSAEIERLLKIMDQQATDLEELRLAPADQSSIQRRLQEYMALMVVLFAEVESLRRRVKDTEKEIETVRRSSLAPLKI